MLSSLLLLCIIYKKLSKVTRAPTNQFILKGTTNLRKSHTSKWMFSTIHYSSTTPTTISWPSSFKQALPLNTRVPHTTTSILPRHHFQPNPHTCNHLLATQPNPHYVTLFQRLALQPLPYHPPQSCIAKNMHTQSLRNENLQLAYKLYEYINNHISHLDLTLGILITPFTYAPQSLLMKAFKCLNPILGYTHHLTYTQPPINPHHTNIY